MPTLRHVMTEDPVAVRADLPLRDVAERMRLEGVRHLPVVTLKGQLRGMIPEHVLSARGRWVEREWRAWQRQDEALRAADVAVPWGLATSRNLPLAVALRMLADSTLDALLVVSYEDHPIGILTEYDAMDLASRALADADALRWSTTPVVCLTPQTPAGRVAQLMHRHRIHHLPVVDEGCMVGVVSKRDLLASAWSRGADITAGELVHGGPVVRASADELLSQVAGAMAQRRIGCVPLTEDGVMPARIVTRTDVLRALCARRAIRARELAATRLS